MVYDLLILGGGPGGYRAAERAAEMGKKVALFEKRNVGGVCLNEGCIPTKTYLYSAKLKDGASHGDKYGVHVESGITVNQAEVLARKNKVVTQLTGGIRMTLNALGVNCIDCEAKILEKSSEGFCISANGEVYTGKELIIATGSEAAVPPIPGAKEQLEAGFLCTNREILQIDSIPERLVVIGGGVIGLEMASYFNSVGSSVVVLEMLPQIGGNIDPELAKLLQRNYKKKGIEFKLECKVTGIESNGVKYEENGEQKYVEADKVLISVGRRPNTADIGLENLGIETNRGYIVCDNSLKTNVEGVYAVGDVNGRVMLAHTAYREAECVVNNMTGLKDEVDYSLIPAVIYTNPEIGYIGETEKTATEKGLDFVCKSISMKYAGRYVAENEGGDGICKMLVDKKTNCIIGFHMIGNYASEILWGLYPIVRFGITIDQLKLAIFPHPTVSEIVKELVFQF